MTSKATKFEVKLTDNSGLWFSRQMNKAERALGVMGKDIVATATMKTPKKSGDLRKSAHIESDRRLVKVIFGSKDVPYAAYQERGMELNGSRVVRHYTTPGTGAHYLKNAGISVTKKGIKWLLSQS